MISLFGVNLGPWEIIVLIISVIFSSYIFVNGMIYTFKKIKSEK